jgi:hypothetical protein
VTPSDTGMAPNRNLARNQKSPRAPWRAGKASPPTGPRTSSVQECLLGPARRPPRARAKHNRAAARFWQWGTVPGLRRLGRSGPGLACLNRGRGFALVRSRRGAELASGLSRQTGYLNGPCHYAAPWDGGALQAL